MRDAPGPGHEPVFPASTGGLSTTAPPGKPESSAFDVLLLVSILASMRASCQLILFATQEENEAKENFFKNVLEGLPW